MWRASQSPLLKLQLESLLANQTLQRRNTLLVLLDQVRGAGIVVKGAGFVLLEPIRISWREMSYRCSA